MKKVVVILKALKLPLLAFFISATLSIATSMYFKPGFPMDSILKDILAGINGGAVFYVITVIIPRFIQEQNAREYTLRRYTRIKEEMLEKLFIFLDKPNLEIVRKSVSSYEATRNYIKKNDLQKIRDNLSEDLTKDYVYYLFQLKELLTSLLGYEFIKGNQELYEKVQKTNYRINLFQKSFELYYKEGEEKVFSDKFVAFVTDFLLGDSAGECKGKDDFIEMLETA